MKKVDCDGCEYLIDCVGIWFCDKNNLPIDKFMNVRTVKLILILKEIDCVNSI